MEKKPENAARRLLRTLFLGPAVRNAAFWSALAAVLVLSLLPGPAVDAAFSPGLQSQDHRFHAVSYAVLTALFLAARVTRRRATAAVRAAAFAGFSALGGVLELLQATSLVNRSATFADAANNAIGAFCGALLPAFFLLRGKRTDGDVPA